MNRLDVPVFHFSSVASICWSRLYFWFLPYYFFLRRKERIGTTPSSAYIHTYSSIMNWWFLLNITTFAFCTVFAFIDHLKFWIPESAFKIINWESMLFRFWSCLLYLNNGFLFNRRLLPCLFEILEFLFELIFPFVSFQSFFLFMLLFSCNLFNISSIILTIWIFLWCLLPLIRLRV